MVEGCQLGAVHVIDSHAFGSMGAELAPRYTHKQFPTLERTAEQKQKRYEFLQQRQKELRTHSTKRAHRYAALGMPRRHLRAYTRANPAPHEIACSATLE